MRAGPAVAMRMIAIQKAFPLKRFRIKTAESVSLAT